MWVIFEGLDKSGKGTLEWEFLKATNFRHVVIDRGPIGYATFDIIFGRATIDKIEEYVKLIAEIKCSDNFLVVYCKVPVDIAMQRLEEHNETCPYDYEYAQDLYNKGIEMLYKAEGIKVIEVDTTKSIEECVKLILGGLE
jgi:deoxyadenosine/deoxycytidine kinase